MNKSVTLSYSPRGPFKAFHSRKQKRAVLVCHRRAGKTVACIHDLIFRALRTRKPNSSYGYIAPLKNQAKTIAWDYLVRAVLPFGEHVKINNQELSVTLPNGSRIRLFGADDPDAFRGMYFDGVVLDEYGDMKPKVYSEIVLPALADRDGWCVFIGTPKGHNGFYKVREQARKNPDQFFFLTLKASESGFLSEKTLAESRSEMTQAEYDQEYECSFEAAIQGSFYAEQLSQMEAAGRMTEVPWVPSEDVHTAWDLGMADSTVIWFYQIIRNEVRVIDHFQTSRTPLPEIITHLHSLPYRYGKTYLPHDSTHDSLQTGKTILEDLWDAGFDCRRVPKLRIANGINAVRKILPYCWFDENNCHEGLESLKLYSKTWSQSLHMFTEQPKHDLHSHSADAFRMLAIAIRDDELAGIDVMEQRSSITKPTFEVVEETTTTTRRVYNTIIMPPLPTVSVRRRVRY